METKDSFFEGLYYESHIPLVWQIIEFAPEGEELVRINEDNTRFLKALTALNEGAPEAGEEIPQTAAELQRLDLKLNLVLEIVGQILASQRILPPPSNIRLDHSGIEWTAQDCPPAGAMLSLAVYLRSELPSPLKFHGVVALLAPSGADSAVRAQLRFAGLSSLFKDELEKFIFRRHRRSIAQRHGK